MENIRSLYQSAFGEQLAFIEKLDAKYIDAIKKYTASEYYEQLNRVLCAGLPLTGVYETIYKDLLHIFSIAPRLKRPVVVWRGIRAPKLDEARLTCQFISTSFSVQSATRTDFVGSACCVLKITVPEGASVLPVEYIAGQSEEWEVILPPDGSWVVLTTEQLSYSKQFTSEKSLLNTYSITYIPKQRVILDSNAPEETSRRLVQLTDEESINRVLRFVSKDDFELFYGDDLSKENIIDYINDISKQISSTLPPTDELYERVLKALQ